MVHIVICPGFVPPDNPATVFKAPVSYSSEPLVSFAGRLAIDNRCVHLCPLTILLSGPALGDFEALLGMVLCKGEAPSSCE